MKKITIVLNKGAAYMLEEGNGRIPQTDRLTALSLLAHQIREDSKVSTNRIDNLINKAVSRELTSKYMEGTNE